MWEMLIYAISKKIQFKIRIRKLLIKLIKYETFQGESTLDVRISVDRVDCFVEKLSTY